MSACREKNAGLFNDNDPVAAARGHARLARGVGFAGANMLRSGFAIIVATMLAAPAFAQVPGYIQADREPVTKAFGKEVADKIFSPAYTKMRQEIMARSTKFIPGFACPDDVKISLGMVTPWPIKPGAVSWIERYTVICTPQTQRNFLAIVEGEARMIELLPGQTLADPALQRDSIVGVQASAVAANPKGCTRSVVTDTKVTTPMSGGLWQERWSLDQCGAKADVDVTFTNSPRGGTDWSVKLVK
jgi:hypothetical protein